MFRSHRAVIGDALIGLAAATTLLAVACSGGASAGKAATTAAGGSGGAPATAPGKAATPPASTGDPQADLLAKGKVIYLQTAGGTGCQLCHGPGGRGDGAANLGAPNIRGFGLDRIRPALHGGVPVMQYIKLTPEEEEAVAAFVTSLGGN